MLRQGHVHPGQDSPHSSWIGVTQGVWPRGLQSASSAFRMEGRSLPYPSLRSHLILTVRTPNSHGLKAFFVIYEDLG